MARRPAAPQRYVALLRGVNVGGKNKVPMPALAGLFRDAGCNDVQTYIQSGNVVFHADAKLALRLPALATALMEKRFGFGVPIVVRSSEELAAVARANPFATPDADLAILMVMFLADLPSPRNLATLDPARSPPDEFVVRGRDLYLRCPNGFARTKLTNSYFDTRLATISTGRNWRTVLKLLELARA